MIRFQCKRIDNRLLKEIKSEIQKISDEINYADLIYYFKCLSSPVNFTEYEDPEDIYEKIKNGDKTIQGAEEDQKKIKSKLGEISSGYHKSDYTLDTIKNVENLYNSRQSIIDLFNDSAKVRSKATYEAKQDQIKGAGLKILTPKEMLQRLPIALAQVKAGKNIK